MTDFERELSRELEAAAEGRPAVGDLMDGARRRLRRRRVAVLGASVAVALVVALTGSALALLGRTAHDPAPTDPPHAAIAGWQTVSYHDVTFQVPSTFTRGDPSQWCRMGDMPGPDGYIELPGMSSTSVACISPQLWYGVTLLSDREQPITGESQYPDGATFSMMRLQTGERLVIVTRDERTNVQIGESFTTFTGQDANGCPASRGGIPDHPTDEAAVCMFEADGQLRQSTALDDRAAESMRSAIREAMRDNSQDQAGNRGCASPSFTSIVVLLDGTRFDVVLDSQCAPQNGLFQGGFRHALTKDLVQQVLVAGYSGIIGRGVPLGR